MSRILIPQELNGKVDAPSSKSMSQRVLLLSAFLPGHKRIGPISGCDDEIIALGICSSNGMKIIKDGKYYNIYGSFNNPELINVGESGTALRMVLGLLASRRCSCAIETEGKLLERPLKPLIISLESIGCRFSMNGKTLIFDGTNARYVSEISINGELSSQFTSSILLYMALNPLDEKIIHIEGEINSEGYLNMTVDVLRKLGLPIKRTGSDIIISGTLNEMNTSFDIEGDYSSASFLIAAGLLLSGKGIEINNLKKESMQPDANILNLLNGLLQHGENSIIAMKKDITSMLEVDVNINPDLAPVIALLGMFSQKGASIKNSDRLSGKESDRKMAIIQIAEAFGSDVTEEDETLYIGPCRDDISPALPISLDHRIVMETILAQSMVSEKFIVHNPESLNKSYPSFIDDLISLGFKEELE
ncbi:MAG: hypothetical protein MPI47_05975 [Cuniculiplasma sp.]|nr:hypothetical protein [Cuniculiplasma sp.]